MKIDQHDLDAFELCIRTMYDRLRSDAREWYEKPVDEIPKLQAVTEAWRYDYTIRYYSPAIDHPPIPIEAMDYIAIMMSRKHIELQADFLPYGRGMALRALISDLFEAFGINDYSLLMVSILSGTVEASHSYYAVHRHYPVNDKALLIAYCRNPSEALSRHY